ncbi:FMN-linked oxidoreductase [Coccomyxa subellipsoidea C-169]|uniref:FMN-linked oxidoreductase n=1 Tax=Coccomyxa subellipsoidea (strain C-169) TaxID=574566 RepID=I0YRU7_COCSC|nr:FMN-linked oxidoreductase [Coccomyxa subellipsoidea C-169]EIE21116.1 FMN-linked oxidoreductase [Coccomyxa subellipsoidea C-169]|eukprot:XP_005645660.1 FMN-linked oxidoreductase [Coccomyxa subellipsoidea C-169]
MGTLLRSNVSGNSLLTRSSRPRTARKLVVTPSSASAPATLAPTYEVPKDANPLLSTYTLGSFELSHRVVLAPLTRCRALGTVPQLNAAEYYAQRTSKGGLLISEATCVAETGHGYPNTPGIYTEEQINAWKPVTQAVRDAGGIFFLQLWHCGRSSHPEYQPNGADPISASAVAISSGTVFTPSGKEYPFPVPRALDISEIPGVVKSFADGARNSIAAGFHGVEIHGANGYLIDQFLKSSVNKRTDKYGGSIPNRCRFALEVAAAVADAVGPELTGIRLSPYSDFQEAMDPETLELNLYLVDKASEMGLLYVHAVESRISGGTDAQAPQSESLDPLRNAFKGAFMAAGGFTRDLGIQAIESGHADLVAYGRAFLANPDLPLRFALPDVPLNPYNRGTFYTPDQVVGYLDYPFLKDVEPSLAAQLSA